MKLKKVLCEVLKKGVEKSANASTASVCGWGMEKMPESMKNRR